MQLQKQNEDLNQKMLVLTKEKVILNKEVESFRDQSNLTIIEIEQKRMELEKFKDDLLSYKTEIVEK